MANVWIAFVLSVCFLFEYFEKSTVYCESENTDSSTNVTISSQEHLEGVEIGENAAKKEVTNEDVIRRRKLERQKFGEAHYVDYPTEGGKKGIGKRKGGKTASPEAKKHQRDRRGKLIKLRRFHNGLELAEGVGEVALGVDLFAKVGAEEAAEAAGGETGEG